MKDRIKAKIDEYIESILWKDEITHDDYMSLSFELNKIVSEEEKAKFNEESRKRMYALVDSFTEN